VSRLTSARRRSQCSSVDISNAWEDFCVPVGFKMFTDNYNRKKSSFADTVEQLAVRRLVASPAAGA
jgi:hypothetical protein